MRSFLVALLSTLCLTVSAATNADQCSRVDVAFLSISVTHPVYFCGFWLSTFRSNTAFTKLSADRVTQACRCIVDQASSSKLLVRAEPAAHEPHALDKRATYAEGCPKADIKLVKSEIDNEASFCRFFMKYSFKQTRKAFRQLSVKRTTAACKCIINPIKLGSSSRSLADKTTAADISSIVASIAGSTSNAATLQTSSSSTTATTGTTTSLITTTTGTTTTTTTTTAPTTAAPLPFCSSAAVQSLNADPSKYPYCWSLLNIHPSSTTVIIATTPTVTSITTDIVSTISPTYVPTLTITSLTIPTLTVFSTAVRTVCISTTPLFRRQASSSSDYQPTYLTILPTTYQTSACSCLTPFGLPTPVTVTSTATAAALTIVSVVTETDTSVTTLPTVTGTETVTTYLFTTTRPTAGATTLAYAALNFTTASTTYAAATPAATFINWGPYTPAFKFRYAECICKPSTGAWSCYDPSIAPVQDPVGKCTNYYDRCMEYCIADRQKRRAAAAAANPGNATAVDAAEQCRGFFADFTYYTTYDSITCAFTEDPKGTLPGQCGAINRFAEFAAMVT
ncbi:hypothetical protein KVT40_002529 [Elsinoe batatas]|uniref:Uncharacterized protein n=1 Tax=Elsinoe batatas TaxID=2601811 RepID=A0A8K0PKB5_9PEZI|nr:hypothetical protein KVT40_002529 [Elsinoe batatas]